MAEGADRENIVKLLSGGGGGYVSGGAISRRLGITRSALWKKVNSLRGRGFVIEAERGRGYRLAGAPDLSPEGLGAALQGTGWEVVYHDTVGSTNDAAMELALKGAPHKTVVVADRQLHGRGRLGRRWHSPPGKNIYMSALLRPDIQTRDAGLLTLLSSVAFASALKRLSGLDIRIKWPNDLVVSVRPDAPAMKLGGILLETRSEPERVLYAVVGVGVDVNSAAGDFPRRLRGEATSLRLLSGRTFSRTEVARAMLESLSEGLHELKRYGRKPLLEKWRALSSTIGEWVEVSIGGGRERASGLALDIDPDGALLIRSAGGRKLKVASGDVTVLKRR